MSLKPNLASYPKKKPLPRNVIDCNRLHREKDLWHENLIEELEQLKLSRDGVLPSICCRRLIDEIFGKVAEQ